MEENEWLWEKYGKLGQSTVNLRVLGKSPVKWVICPPTKILLGDSYPVTEVAVDLMAEDELTQRDYKERGRKAEDCR